MRSPADHGGGANAKRGEDVTAWLLITANLVVMALWAGLGYYSGYRNGKKSGRTRVLLDGQDMGELSGTLRIDRVHCPRCMDTGLVYGTECGFRVAVACGCRTTVPPPGTPIITFEV